MMGCYWLVEEEEDGGKADSDQRRRGLEMNNKDDRCPQGHFTVGPVSGDSWVTLNDIIKRAKIFLYWEPQNSQLVRLVEVLEEFEDYDRKTCHERALARNVTRLEQELDSALRKLGRETK